MDAGTAEIPLEEKATYSIIPYLGKNLSEEHRNMVLAKWMRTLRFGNDIFRLIDSTSYFDAYQIYIKALLKRPQCIVRFAMLTDDMDTCLGFSVSETNILHYVWVQKDERRHGIGKSLVPFAFKYITHITRAGMIIWNNKFPDVRFDPFK